MKAILNNPPTESTIQIPMPEGQKPLYLHHYYFLASKFIICEQSIVQVSKMYYLQLKEAANLLNQLQANCSSSEMAIWNQMLQFQKN